ncbi:MAG: hypothetical protein ABL855_05005 [Sideroxydans sp.]
MSNAHQVSITASIVLNTQTNMNGLAGPSQLTSEKLKIRINTPTISMDDICRCTNVFITAIPIDHLSSEQPLDRVCKTAMLAPSTMTVQVKEVLINAHSVIPAKAGIQFKK